MDRFRYSINELKPKTGDKITPKRINVFVGANNCGKTQALKDILYYLIGDRKTPVVLEKLEIPYPETWETMAETYDIKFEKINGQDVLRQLTPSLGGNYTGIQTSDGVVTLNNWLKAKAFEQFRNATGRSMVLYLNTDNRLKLAMSHQVNDLSSNGIQNALEALYVAGIERVQMVQKSIQEIFNTDILLDTSNLGHLQFKVGDDLSHIDPAPQIAYSQLKSYPLLDSQGDGLRSFLGIVSPLISIKRPIVLLDEPEAFLHPPQALQLGRQISRFLDESQQIFIATHSADFLRGLLSEAREDALIVRLDRAGMTTTMKTLDADMLQMIVTDPLLSSSRVLDGMFYKGVVGAESDSDVVFYQRLFQTRGASDDIHFVSTFGKQTLKKLIIPYQKLGVRFAMIADADVIRDRSEFERIVFASCEDPVARSRIMAERDDLYKYFQQQSKTDALRTLQKATQELVSGGLFPENGEETEAEQQLKAYRARLGKLRAESDELNAFKKSGRDCLPPRQQELFDQLYQDCTNIGLFIVKVGEMESWLTEYGIERSENKHVWIVDALDKLPSIMYDEKKQLWKFLDELRCYLLSQFCK